MDQVGESPWPAPVSPEVAALAKRKQHNRRVVIGMIVVGAVLAVGAIVGAVTKKDDKPTRANFTEEELASTREVCTQLGKDDPIARHVFFGFDHAKQEHILDVMHVICPSTSDRIRQELNDH